MFCAFPSQNLQQFWFVFGFVHLVRVSRGKRKIGAFAIGVCMCVIESIRVHPKHQTVHTYFDGKNETESEICWMRFAGNRKREKKRREKRKEKRKDSLTEKEEEQQQQNIVQPKSQYFHDNEFCGFVCVRVWMCNCSFQLQK